MAELTFPNEYADLQFSGMQANIFEELMPKVTMMLTTEQLDDGQVVAFKIDTKRKIEELCKNVETKCAKLVELKNDELFTEFEEIYDAI